MFSACTVSVASVQSKKCRVGIDVGAESADHEDDDRHDRCALQRGADMHSEHFALEQHGAALGRL